MDDVVLSAALAGLARGLGDFWPTEMPTDGLSREWLDQAERHTRGADPVAGDPRALASVFGQLSLSDLRTTPNPKWLPWAELRIEHTALFPHEQAHGDLTALRDHFKQAVRAVKDASPRVILETGLDAAMRFAWCIPAAGYGDPCTVSRYDHARSVAAVAACLAAPRADAPASAPQPFLLVGADLSGIQAFIYTLASEGAAKSLRARSFYVQLLTEAIARHVLARLGLPITSALYIGGGSFQLLAPGSAAAALQDIEAGVQRRLLVAHRAALGMTLRGQLFGADGFRQFGAVREALGRIINGAKRRPFAVVPAAELAEYLGQPFGRGGDQVDYCRVTGEELPPGRPVADDGIVKSEFVESLEDLGLSLRHATHLALAEVAPASPERVRSWRAALRMFGLSVEVVTPGQPLPQVLGRGVVRLARLTPEPSPQDAPLLASLGGREVVSAYYPFAQLVPWNDDTRRPMLFDELAESSTGLKRWAVLRMDVDNLGTLFRAGFGPNPSLARAAGLSFALRLFFEGWLPALAAQYEGLAEHLYIQYAGGDDVFVVGAWDAVAEYALRIRESFREYVCENPDVTLSGGIALASATFPLYQAARMAGDAEDAAKRFTREGGRNKDAAAFLDEVVSWEDFTAAHARALQLAAWCRSGAAPRSLLQTLQRLHLQALTAPRTRRGGDKQQFSRATWLAAYQLTRVAEAMRKTPDAAEAVRALQAQLMKPNARTNAIALSARWAQFLIRGKES